MAESDDDVPALYSTLADLRLALPCILVGLLLLRWLARGFVAVMGRIQAQGWTIDDDEYAPPERSATSTVANKKKKKERNGAAAEQQDDNDDQDDDEDEEDQVTPVVVKQKRVRRALVLGLTGLAAVTYFAEGVAQGRPCVFSPPSSNAR